MLFMNNLRHVTLHVHIPFTQMLIDVHSIQIRNLMTVPGQFTFRQYSIRLLHGRWRN